LVPTTSLPPAALTEVAESARIQEAGHLRCRWRYLSYGIEEPLLDINIGYASHRWMEDHWNCDVLLMFNLLKGMVSF
jgi:hypothetical protein